MYGTLFLTLPCRHVPPRAQAVFLLNMYVRHYPAILGVEIYFLAVYVVHLSLLGLRW